MEKKKKKTYTIKINIIFFYSKSITFKNVYGDNIT